MHCPRIPPALSINKLVPLCTLILPLNLQTADIHTVQHPDVQQPHRQVLPVGSQHFLLSLRGKTIKHADGRAADVVEHQDATCPAVGCAVVLAPVQILERVVAPVDADLGLGGVDADVGVLD